MTPEIVHVSLPGNRPPWTRAGLDVVAGDRITLLGSMFLGIIAVSPYALGAFFGDLGGLGVSLGGTGLLIAVTVVVETMKQLEAQMLMRNYEGFIK